MIAHKYIFVLNVLEHQQLTTNIHTHQSTLDNVATDYMITLMSTDKQSVLHIYVKDVTMAQYNIYRFTDTTHAASKNSLRTFSDYTDIPALLVTLSKHKSES